MPPPPCSRSTADRASVRINCRCDGQPSPVPPNRRVVELSAWRSARGRPRGCPGNADARVRDGDSAERICPDRRAPAGLDRTPPSSVNLMALPTRFTRIWRRRPGSPTAGRGTSGRRRADGAPGPCRAARMASISATSSSRPRRSKASVSSSSLPASIFEKSRMSLMIAAATRRCVATVSSVAALLVVRSRVQQQARHADHAVHGRADLMAHVGQELALGPVGRLGCLLRRPQLNLKRLLIGHVAGDGVQSPAARSAGAGQDQASQR